MWPAPQETVDPVTFFVQCQKKGIYELLSYPKTDQYRCKGLTTGIYL